MVKRVVAVAVECVHPVVCLRHYANWAAMPGAGNQPTIMRWYGAKIDRNPSCALCSDREMNLDLGEEVEAKLEGQMDLTDVDFELN